MEDEAQGLRYRITCLPAGRVGYVAEECIASALI